MTDKKKPEALKPCPLCGSDKQWNKGFGIECLECGLWLGDGTMAARHGGHIKLWNTRGERKITSAVEIMKRRYSPTTEELEEAREEDEEEAWP